MKQCLSLGFPAAWERGVTPTLKFLPGKFGSLGNISENFLLSIWAMLATLLSFLSSLKLTSGITHMGTTWAARKLALVSQAPDTSVAISVWPPCSSLLPSPSVHHLACGPGLHSSRLGTCTLRSCFWRIRKYASQELPSYAHTVVAWLWLALSPCGEVTFLSLCLSFSSGSREPLENLFLSSGWKSSLRGTFECLLSASQVCCFGSTVSVVSSVAGDLPEP